MGCGEVRLLNGEEAVDDTATCVADEVTASDDVGDGERLGASSLCACWTISVSCCRTSAMSVMGG